MLSDGLAITSVLPSFSEKMGFYFRLTVGISRSLECVTLVKPWNFWLPLRVEFLLKTESGYLSDAEVT